MGWHLLPELAADAPLLASVLAGRAGRLDELACTYPSTTPTSLASLGTGVAPGEHGVLGFTVKVPETDWVLNHILRGAMIRRLINGSPSQRGSSDCVEPASVPVPCCRRPSKAAA